MSKFERAEIGRLALVRETECGRIQQIGLTEEQSVMLQTMCAIISQGKPFAEMSEEYDVVLKSQVAKMK